MFIYDKKLQYPVKIDKPNPRLASIIISQYGGPDGELGASLRYLSQRYSMPFDESKDTGQMFDKWNNWWYDFLTLPFYDELKGFFCRLSIFIPMFTPMPSPTRQLRVSGTFTRSTIPIWTARWTCFCRPVKRQVSPVTSFCRWD